MIDLLDSSRIYSPEWQIFAKQEQLSTFQLQQFFAYCHLLLEWNKNINLTAITNIQDIIWYHFQDSLSVRKFVPLETITYLADIGTGGGCPGIPLKILFPHLHVILIEVNSKKRAFLEQVIASLKLEDIALCAYDWRTFIHQEPYPVELFTARASLSPRELIRAFRPQGAYHNATIIYFASQAWVGSRDEIAYVVKEEAYTVGEKKRKLVFLKRTGEQHEDRDNSPDR